MNTIYSVNQKPYIYTQPPNKKKEAGVPKPETKNSQPINKLGFKADFPSNSNLKDDKNSVVDVITEKILITFFHYKDPEQLKEFENETKKLKRIEAQVNNELQMGTKLNELF